MSISLSAEEQARILVHDTEGWPLAPIIDWLYSADAKIPDAQLFLEQFSKRLIDVGAPVNRFRYSFWTIHPQLAAISYIWEKGRPGIEMFEVPHGIRETSSFIGSPAQAVDNSGKPARYHLEKLDLSKEHPVLAEVAAMGATDYLGIPLTAVNGEFQSAFVSTDRPGGFTDCDIAKLIRLADFLQPKLDVLSAYRSAVELLNTYVGQRTGQRILNGQIKRGDGETIKAALWFSDLRDFTELSENLPADELLALLNSYFEFVFNAVDAHGGEVLRFIGDAMLIVFTEEAAGSLEMACEAALSAAEEAFANLAKLNERRFGEGKPEIRFGVGLHKGTVIYGNVGAPSRLDFTVMGPAVNRTARLESLTKELACPMLFSREFAQYTGRSVTSHGYHHLKGVAAPQEVLSLV